MSNPYNNTTSIDAKDFLKISYTLMLKKIDRLIEIENMKRRNKIPLPQLGEKFKISSNILEAITLMGNSFDYNKDIGELLDIFNDFGILLGQANIANTKEEALQKYNICKIILEGFLGEE